MDEGSSRKWQKSHCFTHLGIMEESIVKAYIFISEEPLPAAWTIRHQIIDTNHVHVGKYTILQLYRPENEYSRTLIGWDTKWSELRIGNSKMDSVGPYIGPIA